jgi:hypothetical protein
MSELLKERLPELSDEEVNRAIVLYKRLKEEDKRPKEEEETGNREPTVVNDDINKLRQLVYNLIQPPPVFKPGDAVRWKKGLKNKKYPKEDQVAVVIQQLDEPII